MKIPPPAANTEPHGWAADRTPADRVLELAFAVGQEATVTSLADGGSKETAARRIYGAHLPFDDGSLDRVVCSEGFQLLPDRGRALEEIRRVLARDGEIEVVVPGSIEGNPPFAELASSLERLSGVRGAASVRWLFCMPEPDDLRGALAAAAFDDIRIDVVRTTDRCSSITELFSRSGLDPKILPEIVPEMDSLEDALIRGQDGFVICTEKIIGRARRL